MLLKQQILQQREAIIESWRHAVFGTYPSESAKFLTGRKNRFANPVGQTIHDNVEELFDQLTEGIETSKATVALDAIVRIRAVQEFSAAEAVQFIFEIKNIVRRHISRSENGDASQQGIIDDLQDFDKRVDSLALLGFDLFMHCREKLYEIRTNETRRRHEKLMERLVAKDKTEHDDEASSEQDK
ncbi:hypothetical protein GF356_01930 [candidate division GN15 bacterium]|nr:hypothetical protein [candidate division GN15 bacterium]